ncbi:MAG: DNA primase [Bacteroidetes bacterium]|nr:MAG: DNA primase [Bacteroidota bacterium]TNF01027.1 MAG: DNA primase [Bacteroidota bacterium]
MAKIPPHIIDDIMSTARIEEVIGEFVNLKRAGSNLKGLSPFTDERTPSFVVSPAKQIFKCFSSGKGGSVVTFLMEKEHFSYPEALRWLADKYGIQVPDEEPATPEEQAKISERESLHIINDFARDHFVETLHNTDEGKNIGLSYFIERGFRPEIIEKFQLGYCVSKGKSFTEHAIEKGYKLEYLEKVGLTKTKEDRHFDFFRGRVMFPIHSVSGRVLGFGGRTLMADKKIAKYFNSPESIIYNKSQILYGLYFAKSDIIKYDNCYLCEGYTDVISLSQAGIENVVSSSGTALTKEQIRLIKRYTKNITILYDGDAAGIKASFRGIDLILEEGMNVKVVLFPDGEDPDSFAKKSSTSELEEYIRDHAQDFISFKADVLLGEGSEDPIVRAGLIREIIESVALIPDQIMRNVYLKTISERFEMNEDILQSELQKLRRDHMAREMNAPEIREIPIATQGSPEQATTSDKKPDNEIDHSEHDLMRILIEYGSVEMSFEEQNSAGEPENVTTTVAEFILHDLNTDELVFQTPVFQRIHGIISDAISENTFLKPSYFLKSEDQDIVRFVSDIAIKNHELSQNWLTKYGIYTNSERDKIKQATISSLFIFKVRRVEKEIEELQNKLREKGNDLDDEALRDILSQQVLLENVKKVIAEKLGRIVLR